MLPQRLSRKGILSSLRMPTATAMSIITKVTAAMAIVERINPKTTIADATDR